MSASQEEAFNGFLSLIEEFDFNGWPGADQASGPARARGVARPQAGGGGARRLPSPRWARPGG
jgi:hypothetical protein